MIKGRWPMEGDMIVRKINHGDAYRKYVSNNCEYIGLVHRVARAAHSGQIGNVYITWSGEAPPDYKDQYGYSGLNIHNIRTEFDVIRGGVYQR